MDATGRWQAWGWLLWLGAAVPICAQQGLELHVAQRAVREWREGERMSLEGTLRLETAPVLRWGRWQLQPRVRLRYGVQYLQLGEELPSLLLPTDNELRLEGTLQWRRGWILDPYVTVGCSTALGRSWRLQGLRRVETARWGDPLVWWQSLGVGYGGGAVGGALRSLSAAGAGTGVRAVDR